ncbi:MAG: hypothetical protein AABY26_05290 [Nanoarchaeota archaeon]
MLSYIPVKDDIEFLAEFLEIERKECRLVCSLCGEFVKSRKPFSPKMYYSMNNIGVTSQDPKNILLPIYESMVQERKENKT